MKTAPHLPDFCLILFFLALGVTINSQIQQIGKPIIASNGDSLHFLEYKLSAYTSGSTTQYPFIFFLHGISERSNSSNGLAQPDNPEAT